MSAENKTVTIYTDGACKGNPGPGGWGAVLCFPNANHALQTVELFGSENNTTNQRMELTAAICALESLKGMHGVHLISDSHYLIKGLTEWLRNWKMREWKTSDKKPVANLDLWMKLDSLAVFHQIQADWVKGHSGDWGNEKADFLANKGVQALDKK